MASALSRVVFAVLQPDEARLVGLAARWHGLMMSR